MWTANFSSISFGTGCFGKDVAMITKVNKQKEGKIFAKCAVNSKTQKPDKAVRIGVLGASGYTGSEVLLWNIKERNCKLRVKQFRAFQNTRSTILCAINMSAGQSDDPGQLKFEHLIDKARRLWDGCPQPVKSFPWNRALDNFIQLILDLILAVVKYLCVPLLAVSSLSEMSYCAHERKLFLVPVPVLIGIAVAGVFRETALDISPLLKDAEVPWHLIAIATFFTFLKLLGPYYPYWGRIFIPHFANGGLWRTLWFALLWYRRPQKESTMTLQNFGNGTHSGLRTK